MTQYEFHDPAPPSSAVKLWLAGKGGSGKTRGALLLMRGMVGPAGKIAVINTERDGTAYQRHVTPFKQLDWTPPFTSEALDEIIKAVQGRDFDGLIVDSASDLWEGEGGVKDQVGTGASYDKWAKPKQKLRRLCDMILALDVHVIFTVRARDTIKVLQGQGKDGKDLVLPTIKLAMDGQHEFGPLAVLYMNPQSPPGLGAPPRGSFWFYRDRIGLESAFEPPKALSERYGAQIASYVSQVGAPTVAGHPDIEIEVIGKNPNSAGTHWWARGSKEAVILQDADGIEPGMTIRFTGVTARKPYAFEGQELTAFEARGWEPIGEVNE